MGRSDGCNAKNLIVPRFVSQQPARIEPPHAVADQVHWLVTERLANLFAQPPSPALDAGDRLNPRHEHPIPGRFQGLRDSSEIRRQGQRADAYPRKTKQAVGQNDRGIEPCKYRLRQHRRCLRKVRSIPLSSQRGQHG